MVRECIFTNVGAGLASAQLVSRYDSTVYTFELTAVGNIIDKNWQEIPYHYKNIKLDEYIIMPNHMHGILIIDPATYTAEG